MGRKRTKLQKKKREMELELDKMSNLPSEITQKILSYLPIREAVRTSLLSKSWRHKWVMLPNLVFDDKIARRRDFDDDDDERARHSKIERIIDHVLLLHIGPIDTFKLSTQKYIDGREFDRWILHLSRNSIKELTLKRGEMPIRKRKSSYIMSSHLFSCQDLTQLGLQNCLLKPPSTFKGFAILKSLDIQNVTVGQHVLEKIIVCCPQLERMILCHLDGIASLNIDAPNLQSLKVGVGGDFQDIKLQNTPNLVDVSIHRKNASSKLLKYFVSRLPHIERLTIEGCLLECAVGSLLEELPIPCLCLNFLSIGIRLNNLEDILTAVCLLRSSPALQELEIVVVDDYKPTAGEEATNWLNDNQLWEFTQLRRLKVTGFSGFNYKAQVDLLEYLFLSSPALEELEISFGDKEKMILDDDAVGDNNRNCRFKQLRVTKVTGFRGAKAEVAFIRFLLSSSPMLETMTLQPASDKVSWRVIRLVTEFKRRSGHADLILLDPLTPVEVSDIDYFSDESDSDFSDRHLMI